VTGAARGRKGARTGRGSAGPVGPTRLPELARDQLSVFLYVALLPDELRAIVKDLGLSMPGFRTEALGDVECCDLVADEIRAAPSAAAPVLRALEEAFASVPLARHALEPEAAGEILRMSSGESALALALWRVLSDRDPAVREAARPTLDWLAKEYYGPRQGAGAAEPPGEAARPEAEPPERLRALERELARARGQIEETRRKGEAQREKLQAQLKEARAREARAADEAARARDAAEAARRELGRAEAELAAAHSTDAAQEAQRARALARDLEAKASALEARLERSRERERAMEAEVASASRAAAAGPAAPAGEPEAEPEEALGTWLMPVYTREFYDSLDGWERRIQRAAFKQAHLLAQDHRHPSLRALPLEGLPGYYRVRVATDVRLIYRRGERQNAVEILSLIDREDLDRYIKQAKTRG
jgi:hypothetical protein